MSGYVQQDIWSNREAEAFNNTKLNIELLAKATSATTIVAPLSLLTPRAAQLPVALSLSRRALQASSISAPRGRQQVVGLRELANAGANIEV